MTVKKQITSKTEEEKHDKCIEKRVAFKDARYKTRTKMGEGYAR